MSGVEDNLEKFLNAERIIIVACGTSWHAGLVAEYVLKNLQESQLKLNTLLSSDIEINYK
jgi:glucosamine 6-phosphate synthetase-like amidotransferase/phosphosugar isomerase protein